jgi:hypothetical protein
MVTICVATWDSKQTAVIAGLDPAIHQMWKTDRTAVSVSKPMGRRVKPGDDGGV